MELYEQVCGARRHASYIRPGGVAFPMKKETLYKTKIVVNKIQKLVNDINEILSNNPI